MVVHHWSVGCPGAGIGSGRGRNRRPRSPAARIPSPTYVNNRPLTGTGAGGETRCTHAVTTKNSATPPASAPWMRLTLRMRGSVVVGPVINSLRSGRHISSDPNDDYK